MCMYIELNIWGGNGRRKRCILYWYIPIFPRMVGGGGGGVLIQYYILFMYVLLISLQAQMNWEGVGTYHYNNPLYHFIKLHCLLEADCTF